MKNIHVYRIMWSILERYAPQLLQIISTLIIARLISPSDFGEVAIVTTFIQISSLFVSAGFAESLIYRVDNSQKLLSSVFFVNILVSILLYILLYSLSDNIANFYSIDRLEILIKVISLNVVIYSFIYIQNNVLFRLNLDFKTPAIITFVSSFLGSCLGVVLAIKGYGVWALVFQTLSINMVQLVLIWIKSKWHPSFTFSFREIKSIFPYSIKIFLNNIVQTIYDNIYTLVIGKVFPSQTLGYYNRMQTITYFTTTNFVYAVESVFFPTLTKRKEDIQHLKKSFDILLRLVTFLVFPMLVFLLVLGKPLIIFLLTDKWIGALPILQLLSIAYIFVPAIYISNSFLKILNKPGVILYSGLIKKFIGIIILIFTIKGGSIITVCKGIVAYFFIDYIISMFLNKRYLNVSAINQLKSIMPNFLLNSILLVVIFYSSSFFRSDFMQLLIGGIVGILLYFGFSLIIKSKEIQILLDLLKNRD